MTIEEKKILNTILDTQESCLKQQNNLQVQVNALTNALIRLDQRVATLYSEEFDSELKKHEALLEKVLKDIALLRVSVSKTVN